MDHLFTLKQAVLVKFDLSGGLLFDVKALLGVDAEDQFYHVEPVEYTYMYPDEEVSGSKVFVPTLPSKRGRADTRHVTHTCQVAGKGQLDVMRVDQCTGHVNISSYLTSLTCYITAYGN